MRAGEQIPRTEVGRLTAADVETPAQRSRRVIAMGRGYVWRANEGSRALPAAASIDVLSSALCGRGAQLCWPRQRALGCGADATLLLQAIMHDLFLRELDREVSLTMGRRAYGAIWPDDTLVLWTIRSPRAPTWWPRPKAHEFVTRYELANSFAFAANDVVAA